MHSIVYLSLVGCAKAAGNKGFISKPPPEYPAIICLFAYIIGVHYAGLYAQGGDFTGELIKKEIEISMDGRGRALDNVFIERLWWTVKFENIYPKHYADGRELQRGLSAFFAYYNAVAFGCL